MATDPTHPSRGRSLVSRRALVDIVRTATLGSYGVIGFAGRGPSGWIRDRLGLAPRGLIVRVDGELRIELDLIVAHHLPIAEVARQVDSAVRYAIRHALGRDVDRLVIHVEGLRLAPYETGPSGGSRTARRGRSGVATDDLAGSGSDVA